LARFRYLRRGVDDLDFIDGVDLNDNDFAFVINEDDIYIYNLDADSGLEENIPFVVTPDSNPGDKRWILLSINGIRLTKNVTGFEIAGGTTVKTLVVDEDVTISNKVNKTFTDYTVKESFANDDMILINDSEAGGAIKKVSKRNLGISGSGDILASQIFSRRS